MQIIIFYKKFLNCQKNKLCQKIIISKTDKNHLEELEVCKIYYKRQRTYEAILYCLCFSCL